MYCPSLMLQAVFAVCRGTLSEVCYSLLVLTKLWLYGTSVGSEARPLNCKDTGSLLCCTCNAIEGLFVFLLMNVSNIVLLVDQNVTVLGLVFIRLFVAVFKLATKQKFI